MKNIHLIPTDKPSKICKHKDEFHFVIDGVFNLDREKYNLYITSDEKIDNNTEPCWCVNTIKNTWNGDVIYYQGTMPMYHYNGFKKVILTTDEDLIKDGVQKIDDEFLQWFIKNNSCEFVEVVDVRDKGVYGSLNPYKIIIPKEEQKQHIIKMMQNDEELGLYEEKTALEEAAEKLYPKRESFLSKFQDIEQKAFIDGANWMAERRYSEDKVLKLLIKCSEWQLPQTQEDVVKIKKWFKNNKK